MGILKKTIRAISNKAKREYLRREGRTLIGRIGAESLADIRFGFFGEFGYGLTCWLPYLNYLKQIGVGPIKTISQKGSSPFYNFSDDHLEIDFPFTDSWGELSKVASLKGRIKERLITPTNEIPREIQVLSHQWKHPNLHDKLSEDNYVPLRYEHPHHPELPSRYFLLNVKNYSNWGLKAVENFYNTSDLEFIGRSLSQSGTPLVLNRFPSKQENSSSYFESDPKRVLENQGVEVIDLSPIYNSLSDATTRNSFQIAAIKHAHHVFATQGGNAALSLILNRHVSIIMRGGFDYPDFIFLSRIYDVDLDVAYNACEMKILQSTLLNL